MSTPPQQPKQARRPKEISLEEVKRMGAAGATQEEMAGHFGVSEKTIYRRMSTQAYNDAYEAGLSESKIGLRRKQLLLAHGGHPTMLIWLGKQLLGQKDKPDSQMAGGDKLHELIEIFKAGPVKSRPIAPDAAPRTGDKDEPVG